MNNLCDLNTAVAVISLNGKDCHPKRPIPDCLPALNKIMDNAGCLPVIIHLDSNVRNLLWHDNKSNVRGTALANWIISKGLFCLNEPGFDPTFRHKGISSEDKAYCCRQNMNFTICTTGRSKPPTGNGLAERLVISCMKSSKR